MTFQRVIAATVFHFCPNCGATVYFVFDQVPDAVAAPVGAFADSDFPSLEHIDSIFEL